MWTPGKRGEIWRWLLGLCSMNLTSWNDLWLHHQMAGHSQRLHPLQPGLSKDRRIRKPGISVFPQHASFRCYRGVFGRDTIHQQSAQYSNHASDCQSWIETTWMHTTRVPRRIGDQRILASPWLKWIAGLWMICWAGMGSASLTFRVGSPHERSWLTTPSFKSWIGFRVSNGPLERLIWAC